MQQLSLIGFSFIYKSNFIYNKNKVHPHDLTLLKHHFKNHTHTKTI